MEKLYEYIITYCVENANQDAEEHLTPVRWASVSVDVTGADRDAVKGILKVGVMVSSVSSDKGREKSRKIQIRISTLPVIRT